MSQLNTGSLSGADGDKMLAADVRCCRLSAGKCQKNLKATIHERCKYCSSEVPRQQNRPLLSCDCSDACCCPVVLVVDTHSGSKYTHMRMHACVL